MAGGRPRGTREWALYKGEELLSMGTYFEIAEEMGVNVKTIRHYSSPAYARKLVKRGNPENVRRLVSLDEDDDLDF